MDERFTHILVGGGLHNGLTALALHAHQPQARIALVERAAKPAGNHTWCAHLGGFEKVELDLLQPLIEHDWPTHTLRFADSERVFESRYACMTSGALAAALDDCFSAWSGSELLCGEKATTVEPGQVILSNGRVLKGDLVLDGRGPDHLDLEDGNCGYQKFVGIEVELESEHGLDGPILMDATIAQLEGFRFLYVLPLGPRRLLLEDTRFSLSPRLDEAAMHQALLDEARRRGWPIARQLRREKGVLPMPMSGELADLRPGYVKSGYAGGWFNPATGYSLPLATRFALAVANGPATETLNRLDLLHREVSKCLPFLFLLNRLLFRCFEPQDMWHVFSRFYRKPQTLIERFYAMRTTPIDRTRILVGRPPKGVKLTRALSMLR